MVLDLLKDSFLYYGYRVKVVLSHIYLSLIIIYCDEIIMQLLVFCDNGVALIYLAVCLFDVISYASFMQADYQRNCADERCRDNAGYQSRHQRAAAARTRLAGSGIYLEKVDALGLLVSLVKSADSVSEDGELKIFITCDLRRNAEHGSLNVERVESVNEP